MTDEILAIQQNFGQILALFCLDTTIQAPTSLTYDDPKMNIEKKEVVVVQKKEEGEEEEENKEEEEGKEVGW